MRIENAGFDIVENQSSLENRIRIFKLKSYLATINSKDFLCLFYRYFRDLKSTCHKLFLRLKALLKYTNLLYTEY